MVGSANADNSDALFIVGNGNISSSSGAVSFSTPQETDRRNALEVHKNGDLHVYGSIYADNTEQLHVVSSEIELRPGVRTELGKIAGQPLYATIAANSGGGSVTVDNSTQELNILGADLATGTTYTNTDVKMRNVELIASSFYATSDRRLKENIKEFRPQKSILDLPVVEFDFKNSGAHQIGCIAQDLQEICPEIVQANNDGYLSINESKLVYLLLLEVKKLKQDLAALRGE